MMAYNTLNAKSKSNSGSSFRITPTNSPVLRPSTRSSMHKTSLQQAVLTLQAVIGTTTSSPRGFSIHAGSNSFAICAGSTVVLAELDEQKTLQQRFYRARPSATSVNPVTSFYNNATPPTTPDNRAKTPLGTKSAAQNALHSGTPGSELADGHSPRAWSSRERVKAVTSVAISPNGGLLAVGETGYGPRVLLYSTAKGASCDVPLSILTEHTFGVRALAFSPDSQYLATLGDVNDGFLFVWSVNPKTGSARLHSTNKCTSFIRDMTWVGQTLVTVGLRHVKVWRLPDVRPGSPKSRLTAEPSASPSSHNPRALSGRNCLLGSLAESTFTSIAGISDCESIVGTDTGALCFLDHNDGPQKVSVAHYFDFAITSIAVDLDSSCLWVGGRGGRIQSMTLDKLRSLTVPSSPAFSGRSSVEPITKGPAVTCMGFLGSNLIAVDSSNSINIYSTEEMSDDFDVNDGASGNTLFAHKDAVLGIRPLTAANDLEAEFYTWSRSGMVKFWDGRGKCRGSRSIVLDHPSGVNDEISNELKVLRVTPNMNHFVSGDRFGVLRLWQNYPWKCIDEVRAHSGEITDIAVHFSARGLLIASSSRDRTVQLFLKANESLDLVQTMDDHVGAVSQIMFINDGQRLLSCSADRTIHIRECVTRGVHGASAFAYLVSKVITLKASPVSMALLPENENILVVSTTDRYIQRIDLSSGRQTHSFRATDADSTDTVVMNSLAISADALGHESPKLLVGVSGSDKSIRVYDLERGVLHAAEFGHTEGVSDVCLLSRNSKSSHHGNERLLISSGIDGLVMLWDLSLLAQPARDPTHTGNKEEHDAPLKASAALRPPLRKVLSKNDIAEFQRQENVAVTPTPARGHSPTFLRKFAKLSLSPSPKPGSTSPTTPSSTTSRRSPISSIHRERTHASPSLCKQKPPCAKKAVSSRKESRRSSMDFRTRARSMGKSDLGALDMSTEQVCRTLKAYRKRLINSAEHLHTQKDLETELELTLRVLSSRNRTLENETDSSGKENEKISRIGKFHEGSYYPERLPSMPEIRRTDSCAPSEISSLALNGDD
ncbi:WD40 repeat domain-containing protein [Aspergillus homomorphus CBS 101889]|uniref:WD repeat protein n=1 Tax=Aspergillus homomorphus (strain CBS 101889) TaxID=1450537 RepID=A0A395IC24_ASPHC|nr:WD repeat protein [Aspergillus homomorphus CBS 101889]RAL17747.1 WD repeat protein [Aspergillus homomorphus CBS 101889]